MELHKALQVAIKHVAKGKNVPKILECVRMGIPQGSTPAWVSATDGNSGVIVHYHDGPCTEALIHRELIAPIAKQRVRSIKHDGGKFIFETDAGVYEVTSENPSMWPGVPEFPQSPLERKPFPGWNSSANKVLHAVGDSEARPEFGYVHFHEKSVQASDGYRVAISDVKSPIICSLPAKMFKALGHDAPVWVAKTKTHGFFSKMSQTHYGKLHDGKSLDCCSMVPEFHQGAWMTVPSAVMYDAVKCAGEVSPKNWLMFNVTLNGVEVKAWVGEEEKDYEANVPGIPGVALGDNFQSPALVLNTKFVAQALKEVDTPNVRLCYGSPADPLRIESAGITECIWPMQ